MISDKRVKELAIALADKRAFSEVKEK